MFKFIVRLWVRHPCRFVYLFLLCLIMTCVLLFHIRDTEILAQEEIRTRRHRSLNENSIEDTHTLFLHDERAWVQEKVAELQKTIFKTPMNDDLKTGEAIPMFIIEEHHGVIPYWYGSVGAGILPHKYGNTLIHIDAHSDFGNPQVDANFPFFRWPKNDELIKLMQSNDLFIVSACLTEMFSRVVWVYPDWAATIVETDDALYAPHIIVNLTIGLEIPQETSLRQQEAGENRICVCAKPLNLPDKKLGVNETASTASTEYCMSIRAGAEEEEVPIPRSQCRLLNKTLRFEAVKESTIIELIRRNDISLKPIGIDGSWILDIDEDFFGVEAPVLPMYNTDISDETIDDLSLWITKTFCAKTAEDELRVDLIFQKIINFVRFDVVNQGCRNLKELIRSYTDEDVEDHPDIRHGYYETELTYQIACCSDVIRNRSLFNSDIPHNKKRKESLRFVSNVFCPYEAELELKVRMGTLLSLLYRLDDDQLKALAEVGICFWSSIPNEQQFRLKVCDGFNRPNNESMVMFYTPTDTQELETRASNMMEIITYFSTTTSAKIPRPTSTSRGAPVGTATPPGLISLVRSARDGYVPRSLAPDIELLIVQGVHHIFNTSQSHVATFYDKDLFGGVRGWHTNRFRIKDLY